MSIRVGVAALAVTAWLALPGAPALAQDDPAATVFATVNGSDITGRDLALAIDVLGAEIERIPEQMRLTVLVDVIINQRLFAEVARSAGVESDENYKRRLQFFDGKALRDTYIESVLADEITEEQISARYDEEIGKLEPQEEMRARHVLVETRAEASVIASLARGGADFGELAVEHSTGPSAPRGGDLDYFAADRMVPEFSEAAAALAVGEISDPVESEFGWHVIKLEDRRQRPPPALADVHDHMKALVLRDLIRQRTAELREGAELTYPAAESDAAPSGDAGDDAGSATTP
jgi:peptidyl-prolyl cis-trans isomerase C